ncbi:NnrS family protein [Bartonella sp. HY761]|uniref:NnrS family protein n=1 Tax=Bartonella sp. HY761 TaxID=2979330 RepID=UPI002208ABDF|nr:NnrS family protein [Bartonella sp. HY761]UXN07126.1 NnrS family protein [Bartonella sp. HY761]
MKKSFAYQPFFTFGVLWGALHFLFWLPFLGSEVDLTGSYTPFFWHAHEMLFGFGAAILAGFLLTVVPNWTGELPFSSRLIRLLFTLWLLGRVAMILASVLPAFLVSLLDSIFLPSVAMCLTIPVIKAKKWRDFKVLIGLFIIMIANITFHYQIIKNGDVLVFCKLAVAAFTVLIIIVGGRMIPAYMRLAFQGCGRGEGPPKHGLIDSATIFVSVIALGLWVSDYCFLAQFYFGLAAAMLNIIRLVRWQILRPPYPILVFLLVLGYAFIIIAFLSITLAGFAILPSLFPIHIITIGAMAISMLAVMIRLCLRYQFKKASVNRLVFAPFILLTFAVFLRALADIYSEQAMTLYYASAILFCCGLLFYCLKNFVFQKRIIILHD